MAEQVAPTRPVYQHKSLRALMLTHEVAAFKKTAAAMHTDPEVLAGQILRAWMIERPR